MRAQQNQTAVILADPPWPHANGSRTNSGKSPKYPLMNLREIANLAPAVRTLSGDHAVLYLWTTSPHLPGAIDVMTHWGFTYRSFRVWVKRKIACGFWVRSNTELCLIGERGRPAAPRHIAPSILSGDPAIARHSAKPESLQDDIEKAWDGSRKIELFARRVRAGWECYGSDLGVEITSDGLEFKKAS